MKSHLIQRLKIKSFPAEKTAFLSKYWDTAEGEELVKEEEVVAAKYADTTAEWIPAINFHANSTYK
jgi:hypothetical protein